MLGARTTSGSTSRHQSDDRGGDVLLDRGAGDRLGAASSTTSSAPQLSSTSATVRCRRFGADQRLADGRHLPAERGGQRRPPRPAARAAPAGGRARPARRPRARRRRRLGARAPRSARAAARARPPDRSARCRAGRGRAGPPTTVADLVGHRTLESSAATQHRLDPHLAHPGRAAGLAPRARSEVGGAPGARCAMPSTVGQTSGSLILHGSISRSAVLSTAGSATVASSHASSCSQPTPHRVSAEVELELLHPGGEGEVEQLGQLGADLAGLGVDRVAAARGSGRTVAAAPIAAASARAVASESLPAKAGSLTSTASSAPKASASRSTSSADGGPEREDGAGAAGLAGQQHALGHRPAAVGAHLEGDAVALEPAVRADLHDLELGDLLDERGDPQRPGARARRGHGFGVPSVVRARTVQARGPSRIGRPMVGRRDDPDPDADLARRPLDAPVGVRCLAGATRRGGGAGGHRAGGGLPAHRHGRRLPQREGRGAGHRRERGAPRRAVRDHQALEPRSRLRQDALGASTTAWVGSGSTGSTCT